MDSRKQPIRDVMTDSAKSVTADTPAREAAAVLVEEEIGSVVVADADAIVTKTDFLAGMKAGQLDVPISELMTEPVITVQQDADIQTAIDRMGEYEIKRLVVEDDTEIVGIVSTTDIRQALATDPDSVVSMFAGPSNTDAESLYECTSCGNRMAVMSKPGTCPDCDAPMRNIGKPRD
jgi:CBS domain-containing protein